jgi:hypothetical protein
LSLAGALQDLRDQGEPVPETPPSHRSPLTWELIGFSREFLPDRAAATARRSTLGATGLMHNRRRPRFITLFDGCATTDAMISK